MDPSSLIDASAAGGLPAPWWFIQFFKVLGFTLHAVPMNLWYAGVVLSMLLYAGGGPCGKRFASRLMTQMPLILAYGINFGVVPLLFLQVAYGKVFYPATVLMAWFWLAIIGMLIPAYYGVYLNAFAWRDDRRTLTAPGRVAGWCAALLLLAIGFTFANGLSLTTNVKDWPALWNGHSVAGAALGTALNVADATLWPRWLMMFGLALGTTAAWTIVDAAWFARGEDETYRRWAQRFALTLYSVAIAWFAIAGSWYVFFTWQPDVRGTMFGWPLLILTALTALSPGLPWLLIRVIGRGGALVDRRLATLVGLAQFGVLALNAISRQTVQNLELSLHASFDPSAQAEHVQWSPLCAFLGLFLVGAGLVVWMVAQAIKASGGGAPPDKALS
jgi:hypothetical protein